LGHIGELVDTLHIVFVWLSIVGFDFGNIFVEDGSSVFINGVGVVFVPFALVGFVFILRFELEEEY
jgi:hypothetical protein